MLKQILPDLSGSTPPVSPLHAASPADLAHPMGESLSIDTPTVPPGLGHPSTARTSVEIHSLPLALLTVFAIIFMLHWAREVFIPLMLGVMISYALSPLVNVMWKWRIPRVIGAAVVLVGIVGGLGSLVYSLRDEAVATIESLPEAAKKFRETLRKEQGAPENAIRKVQQATTEIERAARDTAPAPSSAPRGVTRVQIEKPQLNLQEYLWAGTMGAAGFAAQGALVMFLAFFLMASGDGFRRKLVKVRGSTFSKKKITLQVLDEITSQIQRYLLVQLFTSFLVGVATWLTFLWIGVENAAIWGIAAALLNTIPYLGALIITGGTALVAFLQFGTIGMALVVSGIALLITSIEGFLLTPWLTSRASQMNAVVIFAGVLFWGWLWGMWGLLLGIPILMAVKAICDHVEDLKPVGELLGK
jgi:predicted PurR-regulated permease PerM